jgi:hypothetical protein
MNSRSGPAQAASTDDYKPEGTTLLALEPAPLAHRIAPALVGLGLAGTISWSEAGFVLDRIQRLDSERADLVELIAIRRHGFYQAIGGTLLRIGAFRAKVRHFLATGVEL